MAPASTTDNPRFLLEPLQRLHAMIRRAVVEACEQAEVEAMAAVAREEEGDTIYAVDRISEELLIDFFEREIAPLAPVVLIAEGLPQGKIMLPRGLPETEAVW